MRDADLKLIFDVGYNKDELISRGLTFEESI